MSDVWEGGACGGACSCSTCRVELSEEPTDACCRATVCLPHDPYLTTGCFSSQEWLAKLPAMEMDEEPLIPTGLCMCPLHLD